MLPQNTHVQLTSDQCADVWHEGAYMFACLSLDATSQVLQPAGWLLPVTVFKSVLGL